MVGTQEKRECHIPLALSGQGYWRGVNRCRIGLLKVIKVPFSKSTPTSWLREMKSDLEGYNFSCKF